MPEIGEVARVVHYIKKHLGGRTLASVKVQEDDNVYGKAGCSAGKFQKAMTGKKVLDARQQGKYFWLVMSSPPHPLIHLGMTAWIKFSNEDTAYYKSGKPDDAGWPPKYWKFVLEAEGTPKCEAAFVDSRRFGRIRLLDCGKDEIRRIPPLSDNGPDPVQDKDTVTKEWFVDKVRSKKVPIKAFLLDQANISGVGNWVGDEILYHARIHPEQYTNSLEDVQLDQLRKSLLHICSTAVATLADSSQFPKEWLMKYRWGKGKKDNRLPNGDKIIFLTVGGRTSAVVPNIQKKTGPVAADFDSEALLGDDDSKDSSSKKRGPVETNWNRKASKQAPDATANGREKRTAGDEQSGPSRGKRRSERQDFADGVMESPKRPKKAPTPATEAGRARPARRSSARKSG